MQVSRPGLPMTLGALAISCASLGLVAWFGYRACSSQAILGSRDRATSLRMASYAEEFRFAQMCLGIPAVGFGWFAYAGGGGSRLARRLGVVGLLLGLAVLVESLTLY